MTQQPAVDTLRTEAAVRFLDTDFSECFAERRRFDSLIWEVTKFTFTAYSAMLAAAVGLYTFSLQQQVDLVPAAIALLSVGVVVGLFMLLLLVRTRVYFVIVTRYINEQRRHFLSDHPVGFENQSMMLTDVDRPAFFSTRSTHAWAALLVIALNAALSSALGFIGAPAGGRRGILAGVIFVVVGVAQAVVAVAYLRSRDGISPSEAVFGRRR